MPLDQLRLERQLCFRLYTASRLTTQAYEPFLRSLGITYTQYLVLLVLWEGGEQTTGDICRALRLGVNTVSPLIKRLEALELVQRRTGEADKRQQLIALTPRGAELEREASKIPSCMAELSASCGIDTASLASLAPILDDYIERLSQATECKPSTPTSYNHEL